MCKSKVLGILILIIIFFYECNNSKKETNNCDELQKNNNPTFVDVAPIIFKYCTPCHRAGQSGPFELNNYSDVKKNAKKIKFVTQTGYMPPWPADVNYTHFVGERTLTPCQINTIKCWVQNGCPKGDETKTPTAPVFYTGSAFNKPDTVFKFKQALPISGNGTDKFYVVNIPMQFAKDTFVKYFEFVTTQRKLAHHVNGHLINYDGLKKTNYTFKNTYALDEYQNYNTLFKTINILNDDTTFPILTPNTVYYLPGYLPPQYPSNIGGYKVTKHSSILLKSIHYGPSNKSVLDSAYINVFYGKKPTRPIFETQMGTFGISKIEPELLIHPNKTETFYTHALIDKSISILSVNPHMHLLGKTFWAFATTQTGDTIPLIKINKWDFKWQYYYTFLHPIKIDGGTTIHVYGTFDNTNKNPNNPNKPSKLVTQGDGIKSMTTSQEMFQFIFTYLPYKIGDEKINLALKN